MKRLLLLLTGLHALFCAMANPNWKMHPTFDDELTRLVDTKDCVYFTSRAQPYNPAVAENSVERLSLFRYDKNSDEMETLSTDNVLSTNTVSAIEYSPEKGLLTVVHTNSDIDLLYDNGKTVNIPDFRLASIASGKHVNSIFMDAPRDRIYLSTDFGYIALNDKKAEVAESRDYGTKVLAMSRVGDRLLLLLADGLYSAPVNAARFSLSDYEKTAAVENPCQLAWLGDTHTAMTSGAAQAQQLHIISQGASSLETKTEATGAFGTFEHNPSGVTLPAREWFFHIGKEGEVRKIKRAASDSGLHLASYDLKEIWQGGKRQGICSKQLPAQDGVAWTLTRDWMRPSAPAPYYVTDMVWHDKYGLLVANHGYDGNFSNFGILSPVLVSGYKDGFWTNLSAAYTSPGLPETLRNPNGLAIDPDNKELLYFGSALHGILRIDLTDPLGELHLSRTSDPGKGLKGYVEIVKDQSGNVSPMDGKSKTWKSSCTFSKPEFDAAGNLWSAYTDLDDQVPAQTHILCWPAEARRASVDADHYRPVHMLRIPGAKSSHKMVLKPLKTGSNRNLVLQTVTAYDTKLAIIDTNGTPTDQSDDKVVILQQFTDQDGVTFDVRYVMCFYEDPLTGNVWVGHNEGTFWFNPATVLKGQTGMNRVKVARNDGTNLADYLLNLVKVNTIVADGQGNKWFGTSGAGVVCTASDGKIILYELNTDNSPLPDNIVYGLGYIPSTGSMMISTGEGIAEYTIPGNAKGESASDVRAYPNPVRPDYAGYVTIDGLPAGTLVKITDASGNIVKELGLTGGGDIKWDVTDISFRRVASGVYFILCSSEENGGNYSNVGKVLVVN